MATRTPITTGPGNAAARIVVFAATAVMFLPVLFNDFVAFDDPTYILYPARDGLLTWSGANVAHWFRTPVVGVYLPFTMLSYMADHSLWGLSAFGFHLTSVLLHAASGVLLFGIARQLRFSRPAAVVCALLVTLHPMRVESVAWASERKDVLCFFFATASVAAFLTPRWRNARAFWWSVPLFICAMLAKPMAVPLPFVLLVYAHYRGRTFLVRRAPALAVMAAVSVVFVPVTVICQNRFGGIAVDVPIYHALPLAAYNALKYIARFFLPGKLCPLYARQMLDAAFWARLVLGAAAAATALVAANVRYPRLVRRRLLPLAAAYLLVLAPVSGLVPLGMIDFADRYSYFPHVPLTIAIATVVCRSRHPRARAILRLACAAVLAGWAGMTALTVPVWRNTDTLWGSTLRQSAGERRRVHPAAYTHYARYKLAIRDDPAAALAIIEQARQRGLRTFDSLFIEARCLQRLGRADQAALFYRENARPPLAGREKQLFLREAGECFLTVGDLDAARQVATDLEKQALDAKGHFLLGRLAYLEGRADDADRHFAQAQSLSSHPPTMAERVRVWLENAQPTDQP